MSKLDIRNWTYDGVRLHNPAVIVWRLLVWPFYQATRVVLYLLAYMMYGAWTAGHVWADT